MSAKRCRTDLREAAGIIDARANSDDGDGMRATAALLRTAADYQHEGSEYDLIALLSAVDDVAAAYLGEEPQSGGTFTKADPKLVDADPPHLSPLEQSDPRTADLSSFANHVLPDWDSAMERFLAAVEDKALARGLDAADVRNALELGYGSEVADAWDEWAEGEDM